MKSLVQQVPNFMFAKMFYVLPNLANCHIGCHESVNHNTFAVQFLTLRGIQ